MARLGLHAIQRPQHALDVGDGRTRLLGGDAKLELRVLARIGIEPVQRRQRLGHVCVDRQRLAFLQALLVILQRLLGLLQIGLDDHQPRPLGQGLVQIRDGLVEALGVRIDGDLEALLQLGHQLGDLVVGLGQCLLDILTGRHRRLCSTLVRPGFRIQGLVEDRLRIADPADSFIDGGLALHGLRVGSRHPLSRLGAQLVRLPLQGLGLGVFLPAASLARLGFQLDRLRDRLLGLPARILRALGLTGLRACHLGGQVHRLAGALPGLIELAIGQRRAGTGLVFGDLALAILLRLEVRHSLTADVADPFLRRHRELALLVLDAPDLGQMPVGLRVERIDVLAVFRSGLGQRLPTGGQDLVLDPLHVGRALGFGLAIACCRVDAGTGLVINQFERVGGGLPAQCGLLRERLDQQLGRAGDLHRLRLTGALQRGLLLLVACLDHLDLPLQVGLDN